MCVIMPHCDVCDSDVVIVCVCVCVCVPLGHPDPITSRIQEYIIDTMHSIILPLK